MQESTSINLLAPNGIVRVAFSELLSAEQALAVLKATESAANVDQLQENLRDLGTVWHIVVETEVVARKKGVLA